MGGLDDARSLLLATDLGLATHHARACLLALVAEWRRHAAEVLAGAAAGGRAPGALDAVGLRRINSSSSSSGGGGRGEARGLSGENAEGCGREVTDYGGGVVGDPRRLVALVKLVAATEGALRMSGSGGGGGFGGEEGGLI